MIICPNTSSAEFKELEGVVGPELAHFVWNENEGNPIDKAPNGEDSKLFKDLQQLTGDRKKAIELKAKTYSSNFKKWFGDSKVVDENGEPLVTGRGFINGRGEYKTVLTTDTGAEVNFALKAVELLQSDRAKQVFEKGKKNNWDLNKILTELQVPKQQKQIILDLEVIDREEIILELAANYSFSVEVNTTTEKPREVFASEEGGYDPESGGYTEIPVDVPVVPSQHYSQLTVPGGTNYTENEIATPLITPSIKGHAQFSTDQGIGWFRSDEQITSDSGISKQEEAYYNPDTDEMVINDAGRIILGGETRRILEVQSDLFQKGRDRNDLADMSKFKPLGLTKEEAKEAIKLENQFLQLLNKDNNWVTFFVKSIIQDSAKKGYEKVLFPKGDTAAKIEGHQTLEEFKKEKKRRIKELERKLNDQTELEAEAMQDIMEMQRNEYKELSPDKALSDVKTGIQNEIMHLERELADVESGETQLSAIAKFYETVVTNILRKQGYNPVEVTDEYGNQWNEVAVDPVRDLSNIMLQKQGSTTVEAETPGDLQEKINILSKNFDADIVLDSNMDEIASVQKVKGKRTPIKITKGVNFVFEQNPELSNIGTQEQYSQYLDTIFPDSKVKDIVYHGSDKRFNKFNIKEGYGAFFSSSPGIARREAEYKTGSSENLLKYAVVLNLKNPKIGNVEGYDASPISYLEGFDGLIMNRNIQNEVLVVTKPEQIHILGSKQDIEGFKEFVNSRPTETKSRDRNVITLNPDKLQKDTVIHEYGHIYIDVLGGINATFVRKGIEQLKGTKLWKQVAEKYPELRGNALGKEVLATAIGIEGAQIFDQSKLPAWQRWLHLFFGKVKRLLGLDRNVAKKLAGEMLSGQVREFKAELEGKYYSKPLESLEKYEVDKKHQVAEDAVKALAIKLQNITRTIKQSETAKGVYAQKLQDKQKKLANDLASKKSEEVLLEFVRIAAEETARVKKDRLDKIRSGERTLDQKALWDMHNYISAYDILDEVKNTLHNDPVFKEKFDGEGLTQVLDDTISARNMIKEGTLFLSKELWADRAASTDNNKIRSEFKEDFGREWRKKNKNKKFPSKQEKKDAEERWVEGKMLENEDKIKKITRQFYREQLDKTTNNLPWIDKTLTDPRNLNDDIIQEAVQLFNYNEFDTRQKVLNKRDELYTYWKEYSETNDQNDQKKKYAQFLDGQYFVGKYKAEFLEEYQEITRRDEHGKFIHLAKKRSKWWKENLYEDPDYTVRLDKAKKEAEAARDKEFEKTGDSKAAEDAENAYIRRFENSYKGNKYKIKDKWINKQYDKIKDDTTYKFLMDTYLDNQKRIPENQSLVRHMFGAEFYKLPGMEKTDIERFQEQGILPTIGKNVRDSFRIRPDETGYEDQAFIAVNEQKERKHFIPVYFRKEVSEKEQSYDLFSLVLADFWTTTNWHNKTMIQADMEMLKMIIEERQVVKKDPLGKVLKVFTGQKQPDEYKEAGRQENAYQVLASIIEDRMYSVHYKGNPTASKIANLVQKVTSDTMMVLNYFSAGATTLQGNAMKLVEAAGNEWFTAKELASAEAKFFADLKGMLQEQGQIVPDSLTMLLVEKFDAVSGMNILGSKFVDNTRAKQLFKWNNTHFVTNIPEFYLQATTMYAMLKGYKVTNAEGKYIDKTGKVVERNKAMTLDEAYSVVDGKLVLKDGVYINGKLVDPASIAVRIQDAQKQLFGNYRGDNKELAKRDILGRLGMSMRGWLVPGLKRRFRGITSIGKSYSELTAEERFYSKSMGQFMEGSHVSGLRFVVNFARAGRQMSYDLLGERWAELTDHEKANIRRAVTEYIFAGAAWLASEVLGKLAEGLDDDEDDFIYAGAFYTRRLYQELIFYTNPLEAFHIMQSPAVSVSMVQNTFELITQLATGPTERYEKGKYKDELKWVKDFRDLVPGWKMMPRTFEESYGWLHKPAF